MLWRPMGENRRMFAPEIIAKILIENGALKPRHWRSSDSLGQYEDKCKGN
jgi:hypothetical protein